MSTLPPFDTARISVIAEDVIAALVGGEPGHLPSLEGAAQVDRVPLAWRGQPFDLSVWQICGGPSGAPQETTTNRGE